ncbi:Eco57I restriction-modification methylase domain-containing protein [Peptoniphilus grossensis]|uniref:Eco57I restriction-modification methylase domain-containing protein n=1 Tax=Peptoniphilus grossensis TaxID=1465756 RepID=UPI004069648E
MSRLIDFDLYPIKLTLKKLLQDKTTKKNIIWATNTFEHFGREFDDKSEITEIIFQSGFRLMPRVLKSQEAQLDRTRKKAEVFTPGWIVNEMNNYLDQEWFQRKDVFNIEKGETWEAVREKINFPEGKNWKKYILSRRLEITCGEAPYLVSRYDVSTGEKIDIINRIGILDRKLRVVNENTWTKDEWIKWATRAIESTYGFEYQGDNLLITRVNILMTFVEYFEDRWKEEVDKKTLLHLANIISWNIWQMDGLTDMVPFGAAKEDIRQMNFFDLLSGGLEEEDGEETTYCRIKDWRGNKSYLFIDYKEKEMKKFDFVIGNPPYQEEAKDTSDKPVYNYLMDEAFKISSRVELITPARFLFNAGNTPKKWNQKMLTDKHFKVLKYEQNSGKIFPSTDIKGGVAITYRDAEKDFGAIETFVLFEELNSIMHKVKEKKEASLSDFVYSPESYKLTEKLHQDFPEAEALLSKGHKYDVTTNIFDKLDFIFKDKKGLDKSEVEIIGRHENKRASKWIRRDYLKGPDNFEAFKVFIPKSNGSGALGEVLSTPLIGEPLIGEPLIGHTQTFISIGNFKTLAEAEACFRYIKSKFARVMLGILKITQDNKKSTWKYVPMQDFTNKSDIDWSKSIPEIDRQLYAKYNLSQEEIDFIEKNVKEME